ncbi:transglycosylase SLT domain-containing protein [Nocardioides sp.]|uniref:transglycosylase SLT domain-containing protein n=1 Tax=Nocardioides sp. TaxID=35761 RepID=UPI00351318B2
MSVAEVTSRIAAIQGQLALLAPAATSASATDATAFARALSQAGLDTATAGGSTGAKGEAIVAEAKKYLGMPYVWGGSSPASGGMDCSGLVQYVYGKFGIDLPRVSADQARAGTAVASMDQAQPGDLIAWDNSSRNNGADHIAIYAGDGMMIEAPRTGLDIRMVPVPSTPDYIRRVLPETSAVTGPTIPGGGVDAVSAAIASGGTDVTLGRVSGGLDVPFADLFASAGARYGLDPRLLAAVARQESGFDPSAVSPAGAQGLMQLMPGTADGLGVRDPFQPAQAVDGAARLLTQLLDRFDGRLDLALAGYNAGPGAVDRYDGVPPYPETRNYVSSILTSLGLS